VRPGGVRFDLNQTIIDEMIDKVGAAIRDVDGAAKLLFESHSVEARFDETGRVSKADAQALGLVGMAARACDIDRDIRLDFPSGVYRFHYIPISTALTGDVYARASVRHLEIQRSGRFILDQLRTLPQGALTRPVDPIRPNALAVGLSEGWRGEICHVALTDAEGKFLHYKVVDPSFHNWVGLMMALRDQAISDFPLCNKSFNLSYCGHDL
jgi:Ni,Fe-hydrogenase III large subunit